jgi:thiamine transport system substrate-binding protein
MKKLALLLTTLLVLTGCAPQDVKLVRLAAHDSFAMSEELIAQFESETGYQLEILRLGDTGSLTNQLILTKNAPIADVAYGIDNTFLGKAEGEKVFQETVSAINYSDVCFNYDIAWFQDQGITPPSSWRDLGDQAYRGLTVVTNPNFSSPGLAFLATTHAGFETSAEVFAYWRSLRDNNVKIAGSWEDAYFSDFTRYGGNYPIVLSYASSPAAEVNADGTAGSAALLNECFRQTEYAGIIDGGANRTGARALISFMLGDAFQRSVPEAMFVYPAISKTEIPEAWAKFALPATSTIGDNLDIDSNRERWLIDWSDVFDN